MTNHAYWNLSGDFSDSTIGDHQLTLNCPTYLPMSSELIPTGEIAAVQDTPFDFTAEGPTIASGDRLTGAIDGGGEPGIDHAFVVKREEGESVNDSIFRQAG